MAGVYLYCAELMCREQQIQIHPPFGPGESESGSRTGSIACNWAALSMTIVIDGLTAYVLYRGV